jgi:hypothetical protein
VNDFEKLAEISRLLDEAYKHYFSYEGHCKSSEGYMHVEYGNYWDRADGPLELKVKAIHIYSYVFCRQGRSADFDSIDDALEAVRSWHADEMAYDPNTPEAIENNRLMDEIAGGFIKEMMESSRLTVVDISKEDDERS